MSLGLFRPAISMRRRNCCCRLTFKLTALTALILPFFLVPLGGADRDPILVEEKIGQLVRQYSGRLGITQHVIVAITPGNERLVSIESAHGEKNTYRVSFEPDFVRTLNDVELNAAVAHEMGHLWIYSHFPYLQTELLANQQALKLVSCTDLARVYEKVRRWNAGDQNPAMNLGCVQKTVGRGEMK